MRRDGHLARVLAIDPTPRGFGFIVLEGRRNVVDWGVRSGRRASIEREQQLLARIADLLHQYRPRALIVEDIYAAGGRRSGRVRLFIEAAANLALWKDVAVRKIAASNVQNTFVALGASNKYEIACVIASQLPELATWLPRPRKVWTGEDYRMAIFDAAALAITHLCRRRSKSALGSD